MQGHAWLWLLPAAPLLGSILCGILHFMTLSARRHRPDAKGPAGLAAIVAALAMAAAFAVSLFAFGTLLGLSVEHRVIESPAWNWIATGEFPIDVALVIDPLSSVMTLVIIATNADVIADLEARAHGLVSVALRRARTAASRSAISVSVSTPFSTRRPRSACSQRW